MALDTSGSTTLSNDELVAGAMEVFEFVRIYKSPKDAAAVLALAYVSMVKDSFPPENRAEAKDAVDSFAKFVKSTIDEGWQ